MDLKSRPRPSPVGRLLTRSSFFGLAAFLVTSAFAPVFGRAPVDFDGFLKPLFAKSCVKCHGGEKTKGKVNLKEIGSAAQLLAKPDLLKELVDVVDARDMPPEDEPQPSEAERARLLDALRTALREASAGSEAVRNPVRRLNRFQYNNVVKDIFGLKLDLFPLPEKLMTRLSPYLQTAAGGAMPDRVDVASFALAPKPGMKEVKPFPKDLRAAHGYDNQANQLTLSPLLLDAFLRLSVSIVDSPDFHQGNVGVWNEFFKEPEGDADLAAEVRQRLDAFLMRAFRRPSEKATLDRYVAYVLGKLKQDVPFTAAMKKVASAALSSPKFLYRYDPEGDRVDLFALASELSFFLWVSGPDDELLRLAESGELAKPEILGKTIDRMLSDPRVERFLDVFPAQWMQLENVLAATPDPKKHRLYGLDPNQPAGLRMLLEPLLLFDAVFLENRPLVELLAPAFSYRSDFLKTWYHSDLTPPPFDAAAITEENRVNAERRKTLETNLSAARTDLAVLLDPIKEHILETRRNDPLAPEPVDLKPYAAWEFDGDLKSSVGSFELKVHGKDKKVRFENGGVVLRDRTYLQSPNLPVELKAKSLEVRCFLPNLDQRGGGVMGIQGPGDFFDTIVLGERKNRHWISGSNGHSRTLDFPESTPETAKPDEPLHLVLVYEKDGTTTLYRNGKPYGKPYRKGAATFPKNRTSVIFGLRHLPPGGNKHLAVTIESARLYHRALTPAEASSAATGQNLYVSAQDLDQALNPEQKAERERLTALLKQTEADLKRVPPPKNPNKERQAHKQRFDNEVRAKLRSNAFQRAPVSDPRYGGVITNAAVLSMTSGPKRTHPISRGAWIIEVIFNDPPPPPPNDVPPLKDDADQRHLTIRERFAKHRENPDCAGCHSRIDPLGFALENFDVVGRWRDKYENGRDVDPSGTLLRKHPFADIVRFKQAVAGEDERFAKAFTAHLLRYGLARELAPADHLAIEAILQKTAPEKHALRALVKQVARFLVRGPGGG